MQIAGVGQSLPLLKSECLKQIYIYLYLNTGI